MKDRKEEKLYKTVIGRVKNEARGLAPEFREIFLSAIDEIIKKDKKREMALFPYFLPKTSKTQRTVKN